MKNGILIIGFILCTLAGMVFMQMTIPPVQGEWALDQSKMLRVDRAMQPIADKCKMDRLNGKLQGYEASAKCSSPALREVFLKEGFPDVAALDAFLKAKQDNAVAADAHSITEEQLKTLNEKAFDTMLRATEKK